MWSVGKGARIALVSPAGAVKAARVRAGVKALKAAGYKPVLMPHALAQGPLYYAGTAAERAADLVAAFRDKSIAAVVCTRGGWGSAELLPLLDAKVFRGNSKPFVGYSDHTTLHIWLQQRAGLKTFYGPMVSADWAREGGVDFGSWDAALSGSVEWMLDGADGLAAMQKGSAKGVLRGGCLSILAESLGTPYAYRPQKDTILFLEDVNHKPYQWDRQLLHLKLAGALKGVKGIVFGDMGQCVSAPAERKLMLEALRHGLRGFRGPVAIGLRSGHVDGANVTLPLGAPASLVVDANGATLALGEEG
jgi:muramoyltetrapeptide carboxypeptidase